jgi:hypothetical protein
MIKHSSIFSQLLTIFPRSEFATLVSRNRSDYGAKGFNSWTQLVCMLFCHLAQAKSLREICNGLRCCLGKMRHLGILRVSNKSILSYANEHIEPGSYTRNCFTRLWRKYEYMVLLLGKTGVFVSRIAYFRLMPQSLIFA